MAEISIYDVVDMSLLRRNEWLPIGTWRRDV